MNAFEDTKGVVRAEECSKLEKYENEWVISGCKDDISIRLLLNPEGGYAMKVCGGWSDGKDVAQNAADVLKAMGMEVNCDPDSVVFLREVDDKKLYDVCGYNLYIKDGCIV